ncbi:MAG TPA: hypothetical protein VM869_17295 [Enhygromyxa sp.]|nr:hypothetical protein [Enhygromyxa sp.]
MPTPERLFGRERDLEVLEITLASEQALGHAQLGATIAGAELEQRQLAVTDQRATLLVAQRDLIAAKIVQQPARALVAILRRLGEQLHHHAREQLGHLGAHVDRRLGELGEVAVHELERLGGGERDLPAQQFVERDAERVEVGAVIERPVHAPGLLGRDIGERAFESVGRDGQAVAVIEPRRDAEVDELHTLAGRVDQDVARLDVLVDDAARMDGGEAPGELQRERQEALDRKAARRDALGERDALHVLHHDRRGVLGDLEAQVADHVGVLEAVPDLPLSPQPRDRLAARAARREGLEHDRGAVMLPPRSKDPRPRARVDQRAWFETGQARHSYSAAQAIKVHRPSQPPSSRHVHPRVAAKLAASARLANSLG